MKKLIILFGALFCCSISYAQTIYTDGAVISADSITYEISVWHDFYYTVINVENELYDQDLQDLNGQTVSPFDYYGAEMDMQSFQQAFFATFTSEETAVFRDNNVKMNIFFTKNNEGRLLEVVFHVYLYKTPFAAQIPPEKFAAFEKNLKKYLRWTTVTEDEKKLKFMHEMMRVPFAALADVRVLELNPEAERVPDSLKVVGVN